MAHRARLWPCWLAWRATLYPLLCTLLGLAVGWLPMLVHGPIAAKYDALYVRGDGAVWA